jgi:energy-coupling factor transport system substrate-specific component
MVTQHIKRIQKIPIRDLVIFAMLASIMFASRVLMQWIHGVHLLGLITAAMTLTYRARALIPLYVYILLDGLFSGFSFWWVPYLYIWLPLWLMFMIVGKLEINRKIQVPLYMVLCGLHGLLFGIMYAPLQALMFGFSFEATVAWVIAGLWFDVIHGIGNFAMGSLIVPLTLLLKRFDSNKEKTGYKSHHGELL